MKINISIFFVFVYLLSFAQKNKLDSLLACDNFDIVIRIVNKQLQKDSLDVNTLYYKAMALNREYKYNQALSVYQKLLDIDSTNYIALSNVADIYYNYSQWEKAIKVLKKLSVLRPGVLKNYYMLALLNTNLKYYLASINYCDSALSIFPEFEKCLILKASNLIYLKDTLSAIPIYMKLFNKTHKNRFVRQLVFFSVKEYQDTILNILNNAIDNDSSNSYLYKMRGYLFYHLYNYDKAEINLQSAYDMGDTTQFTYKYLALSAYKNGDYSTAYDNFVKIDNVYNNPSLLYLMAISHQRIYADTTSLNLLNAAFKSFYNIDILQSIKSEIGQTACTIGDRYQRRHIKKKSNYYFLLAEKSYKQSEYIQHTNTTDLRLVTLYDFFFKNVKTHKQILKLYQKVIKEYPDTASVENKFINKRIRKYREIIHFDDN